MNRDAREMGDDFRWSDQREPHFTRRKQILRDHPEVARLFGPDPRIVLSVVPLVVAQLVLAWHAGRMHWAVFVLVAYVAGSTIAHTLYLAIHELAHDLAFRRSWANNLLALFANLPMVLPYSVPFRHYHALHHWQMGGDGIDTDLPSRLEARLFRGPVGKFCWLCLQILFYAARPLFTKQLKPDFWMVAGWIVQFSFIAVFFTQAGWAGIAYLVLSLIFSGGLNPAAGHFVAEHYEFVPGQETYSYYGPANRFTYNVGYHNEHHDFPNIPGSRLPELRRIAAAHYDGLYSHTSWIAVLLQFLGDRRLTLYSRIKRTR